MTKPIGELSFLELGHLLDGLRVEREAAAAAVPPTPPPPPPPLPPTIHQWLATPSPVVADMEKRARKEARQRAYECEIALIHAAADAPATRGHLPPASTFAPYRRPPAAK